MIFRCHAGCTAAIRYRRRLYGSLRCHEEGAREDQRGREKFAQRRQEAARMCRHVSTPLQIVNCDILDLHGSVRDCGREATSNAHMHTRNDIILVLAREEITGNTQERSFRAPPPKEPPSSTPKEGGKCFNDTARRLRTVSAPESLTPKHNI